MTKETKVLDSTVFLPLEYDSLEWATQILNSVKNYRKHDTKNEVSKYGFNIAVEASKLEIQYNKLLSSKEN